MTSTVSKRPLVSEEVNGAFMPGVCDLPSLRSLAAELHDGVAQELFAARWVVEEVLASTELPAVAEKQLQQLSLQLTDSAQTLRSVLLRWNQPGLGPVPRTSTVDRIRATVHDFEDAQGIPAVLTVSGSGPDPAQTGTELLVRSAREALTNVAKHANATEVAVSLELGPACWTVTVEDDGSGDPAEVQGSTTDPAGLSFGLCSLAGQAAEVGGTLTVDRSCLLEGIALSVSVPVRRASW